MNRKNARLAVVVSGLAVLAVALPATASAKTVSYSAKLSSATLSTANDYPNPGGTALLAGAIKAKPFGAGAVVDHVKITGHPESNVFTFKGTETVFYGDGTQRDVFTGTSTVNDDGSLDLEIKGAFKGGTGRYEGATGKYKFNGHANAGATVVNGASTGKITF